MKTPIVILHGWGASSQSFRGLKELLEKEGYMVEVPDLPGFGNTPLTKALDFSDYVRFVEKYIGNRKVTLIGHSFGGRIAAVLAPAYTEHIEKLVLVNASGITHPLSWKKNLGYFLAKGGKMVFSLPILSIISPLTRKLLYVFLDEWDYYKSSGTLLETFKNVYKKDIQEDLPHIHVPTLIVWGEKDITTPVSDAYVFHKKIRRSKLTIVPGASHELPYKMPHVFVEKILPFLQSV